MMATAICNQNNPHHLKDTPTETAITMQSRHILGYSKKLNTRLGFTLSINATFPSYLEKFHVVSTQNILVFNVFQSRLQSHYMLNDF
jgi:hypothetical protein